MDLNKLRVRRSFIFTPGLQPEMFPKALASGADMVCIELEDGIAMKDKDEARKNTIEALNTGFIWGYQGLINNIILKIQRHTKTKFKLIFTGGHSNFFKKYIKSQIIIDRFITIKGLIQILKNYEKK